MKKILVVRYGALGDMMATLPVFQSLKNAGYSVTLAGNGRFGDFLLQYGHIDEFISSDGGVFLTLFAGERDTSVSRYLEKFDLVLSYTDVGEPFSKALMKSFPGKILFHPAAPAKIQKHIVTYLLEPVREITDRIAETPEIRVGICAPEKCFVIHPGSGSVHKNWPEENFLEVYRRLSAEKDGYILLGYAEERMKDFWLSSVPGEKIMDSPDMNTLMTLAGKSEVYIGNDSGISHLFAAAGVRSCVIFGPTAPSIWSPRGKNVKILYKKESCSPCDIENRKACAGKNCLNSITAADVLRTLEEFYGNEHNI